MGSGDMRPPLRLIFLCDSARELVNDIVDTSREESLVVRGRGKSENLQQHMSFIEVRCERTNAGAVRRSSVWRAYVEQYVFADPK